jgi:Na+-transporting NADH:ubiquinone oxidoreductase subunit F
LSDLLASVLVFTGLVMSLVLIVLAARRLLAPSGEIALRVNDTRTLVVPAGQRLLTALLDGGIQLPAACGGKGTCGLCRVHVLRGGAAALPLEVDRFSRRDLADGMRLACQLTLREDTDVRVPEEILDVRSIEATVHATTQMASLMKELVLELPPQADFPFRTGSFVQVTCPPYTLRYADMDVAAEYRAEWDRLDLWKQVGSTSRPTTRAYSLANYAGESDRLMLVVRLATPPPAAGPDVPPGIVSSWIFGLKPGDAVTVAGPYGDFFVEDGERELVFVGGGAGIGPMRAHILDQVERGHASRPVTFFYGARNQQELLYKQLFDRLEAEHANFHWYAALSEPRAEDWQGRTGFIHEHLLTWVQEHESPETCEYYICGPPLMLRAVKSVLDGVGVLPESIHADDFGG